LATIENRAPNLNFSYTKIPQVYTDSPVNYARYAIETVHVNSENPDYAWDFINFAASQKQVPKFLDSADRISALRTLIGETQQDTILGSFAQQALTAKTWYHGTQPDAAVHAFEEMVADGIAGTEVLQDVIGRAQSKVSLTIQ
jgi:ABC-type glycerol-3-phosphate transport system substrate-binding protein